MSNRGPFGFSFDRRGNLLVAIFLGGPGLTGAAGSFQINTGGPLTAITPLVVNGQLDTCWLENNGTYAYASNYTSGTISSYSIQSGNPKGRPRAPRFSTSDRHRIVAALARFFGARELAGLLSRSRAPRSAVASLEPP